MEKNIFKQKIIESNIKSDFYLPISLLSFSCIAKGFTSIMKERFNFSCGTVGIIGNHKAGRLYINYQKTYNGMEKVLNDNWPRLDAFFEDIKKDSLASAKKIIYDYDSESPLKTVSELSENYQKYVNIICFYDCFWKYLDRMEIHSLLRSSLRNQIIIDHANAIRGQMNFIRRVRKLFNSLAKKMQTIPDLFRSMTIDEFELFLKTQSLDLYKSQELLSRRHSYYYFYFGDLNKEELIKSNDLDMIKFVKDTLHIGKKNIITGSPASCGTASGIVTKPSWYNKNVKTGQIIVARSNIINSEMIDKCAAVVVENGGVLNHAAIICREMKKPCILSASGATKIFKNGDKIKVDADKGLIEKII